MDKTNLSNIRQRFWCSVYNWKIHEIAAEEFDNKSKQLKVANIVLTWITATVLILPQIINWEYINSVALFLWIIQIIFLIIQLYFPYEELKNKHKKSAQEFQNIRNDYINLMSDIINNMSSEMVTRKRDELNNNYRLIISFAPQTTVEQYNMTRKKLKVTPLLDGEDFTLSEDEIDHFLTTNLKLSSLHL